MRVLTKPSTAACTLEHYTAFLLAEGQSAGCVRLAEVSGGRFCHDAANRFLNREEDRARDLFEEVRPQIVLAGGTLSVDDTVLAKPYSEEGKTDLVGYFWSGKHGRAVKGVCLVSLLYTDVEGVRVPVSLRAVDKAEAKTKNELFREMVEEVLAWGLAPAAVSAHSWYSGVANLKFLKDKGLGFLVGLEKKPHRQRARARVWAGGGHGVAGGRPGAAPARLWLCERVSHRGQKQRGEALRSLRATQKKHMKVTLARFEAIHARHWGVECFHRALKQLCHAEKFFVRWKGAIRNHLFCALRAFVHLETALWRGDLYSWCDLKRHVADLAVTNFIQHRTAKLGA